MIPSKVKDFLNNNLRKIFEDFSIFDLRNEIDCDLTVVIYGFHFSDMECMPNFHVISGEMVKEFYVSLLDWSLLGSIGYNDDDLTNDFNIFIKWLNEGENKIKLIEAWDSLNTNNTYLHYIEKEHDNHVEPFNVEKSTYDKIRNSNEDFWYDLESFWNAKGEVNKAKRKMKHYKKMLWLHNKKKYVEEIIIEPFKIWLLGFFNISFRHRNKIVKQSTKVVFV